MTWTISTLLISTAVIGLLALSYGCDGVLNINLPRNLVRNYEHARTYALYGAAIGSHMLSIIILWRLFL